MFVNKINVGRGRGGVSLKATGQKPVRRKKKSGKFSYDVFSPPQILMDPVLISLPPCPWEGFDLGVFIFFVLRKYFLLA